MKALPSEARTRNLSGKEFCRYCIDGYVVAQFRPPARTVNVPKPTTEGVHEELAPCPFCELGVKIEYQEGSPWGADGFWQGRGIADLQTQTSAHGWKPLTGSMAADALKALGRTIGVVFHEPGADGADDAPTPTPEEPAADSTATSNASFAGFGTVADDPASR